MPAAFPRRLRLLVELVQRAVIVSRVVVGQDQLPGVGPECERHGVAEAAVAPALVAAVLIVVVLTVVDKEGGVRG